jgi:FKBP-type peptidyl-prolyl cis-trans isomerase
MRGILICSFLLLWSSFTQATVPNARETSEESHDSVKPSRQQIQAHDEKMERYRVRIAKKYLEQKANEEGIIRMANGVLVEVMKKGLNFFAKSPRRQDRCKVAFVIKTKDGEIIEECKSPLTVSSLLFTFFA